MICNTNILANEIHSKEEDNMIVKRNGATKLTLTNAYTLFNFIQESIMRKEDWKVLSIDSLTTKY